MAAYTQQVRPLTLPSCLQGQKNGQLPDSILLAVPGGTRMVEPAARAATAMHAAALADGVELFSVSDYRPLETQQSLFASRYTTTYTGIGCRTCGGVRYCKRSSSYATAACPGTSNHGWGLARDMDLRAGVLVWLEANAWEFGYGWELVPEEPWHIRYCTGDAIPQSVLDFEASSPGEDQEDDMRLIVADGQAPLAVSGSLVVKLDATSYNALKASGAPATRVTKGVHAKYLSVAI